VKGKGGPIFPGKALGIYGMEELEDGTQEIGNCQPPK